MQNEPEVYEISSDSGSEGSNRHKDLNRGDKLWKRSLKQCLNEITPCQIAYFNKYTEFPNPGLELEKHAQISLPLSQHDAEAIKTVCRQPPLGDNGITADDITTSKTWELDSARYATKNPQWDAFFTKILGDTRLGLGAPRLTAKPYKLLLYEPGFSFKHPIDRNKEERQIGFLFICLPSRHEGGDVHLSFRSEQCTLQTAPTSIYDLSALAWYSDITHEVKEVTSGYCLTLVYKLFQPEGKQLSATQIFAQRETLGSLLSEWQSSHLSTGKIAYGLNHPFSGSKISLQNLKGRDRLVCEALNDQCAKFGLYLLLAEVVRTESEPREYGHGINGPYYDEEEDEVEEEGEELYTELKSVFSSDGELVASDVSIEEDEVIGIDYEARPPDSDSEGGRDWDDSSLRSRYHDTAVVLIPRSRLVGLLQPDTGNNLYRNPNPIADKKAVKLVKMVAEDLERNAGDTKIVNETMALMKHALHRHVAYDAEVAGIFAKWGLKLGIHSLFVSVLDSPTLECVEKVDHVIVDLLQKRFDGDEGKVDWNKWLGFLTMCSATKFDQIMLRIISQPLSSDAKQSLTTWSETVIDQKLDAQTCWDIGDCALIVLKMKRRLNDKEWMMEQCVEYLHLRRYVRSAEPKADCSNRFLPSIASQGSKELLLQLLHSIASERDSTFGGRTTEMYNLILTKAGSKLLLDPNCMHLHMPDRDPSGTTINVHTYMFIRMIEEGYANEAREETSKVLNAACAGLASTEIPWMLHLQYSMIIKGLLLPLAILLEAYLVPPMPGVRQLYERCLRRVHETLPTAPITYDLQGWAHRPRGCNLQFRDGPQYRGGPLHQGSYGQRLQYYGGSCSDCQELDRFLTSPTERVWRLTAAEPRRKHIESRLHNTSCRLDTIRHGSPLTLVVQKEEPEANRLQRHYYEEVQRVSRILEPLRLSYMQTLLGEAEDERLVMLNQSPPILREAVAVGVPAVNMNQAAPFNIEAVSAAMPGTMPSSVPTAMTAAIPAAMPAALLNQPVTVKREVQPPGPPPAMINQPVAIKREIEAQGAPPPMPNQPVTVKSEIDTQIAPTVMMNQPMANNGQAVAAAMPTVMSNQPVTIKTEASTTEPPSAIVNQPVAVKVEAEAQDMPPAILNQPVAVKREAEAEEMPDVKRARY